MPKKLKKPKQTYLENVEAKKKANQKMVKLFESIGNADAANDMTNCFQSFFCEVYQHQNQNIQRKKSNPFSTCKNKFCHVCNFIKSRKTSTRTYTAIRLMQEDKINFNAFHLTLTIKNPTVDTFAIYYKLMNEAFDYMMRTNKILKENVIGWQCAREVSQWRAAKKANELHPHLHVLLLTKPAFSKTTSKYYGFKAEIINSWLACLEKIKNKHLKKLQDFAEKKQLLIKKFETDIKDLKSKIEDLDYILLKKKAGFEDFGNNYFVKKLKDKTDCLNEIKNLEKQVEGFRDDMLNCLENMADVGFFQAAYGFQRLKKIQNGNSEDVLDEEENTELDSLAKAVAEVCKYPMKPADLQNMSQEHFKILSEVLLGKRMISRGGLLMKYYNLAKKQVINDEFAKANDYKLVEVLLCEFLSYKLHTKKLNQEQENDYLENGKNIKLGQILGEEIKDENDIKRELDREKRNNENMPLVEKIRKSMQEKLHNSKKMADEIEKIKKIERDGKKLSVEEASLSFNSSQSMNNGWGNGATNFGKPSS